ncbi:NADPH-dependent FMN reductase family protein [Paraburkholderia strydomiana]|uniref:hypothetical protein n=1 Tax=Paraburkholderia strydomiana TaxID=1245417 RepID=UPI0038B8C6B0
MLAIQNVFYHWGAVIVPLGYTAPSIFAAGGNPYGVSFTDPKGEPVPETVLAAARCQGTRIIRFADVLAANREHVSS